MGLHAQRLPLCLPLLVLISCITSEVGAATEASTAPTVLTTSMPQGPDNVTLVQLTITSFNVSWNSVDGDNVTYDIEVSSDFLNGTRTEEITDDVTSPYTVTDRTPGQLYSVEVFAVSGNSSIPSNTEIIRLEPDKVDTLLEDPNNTDSGTVTATWTKGDGIVSGYDVTCSNGTSNHSGDDQTSASCRGDIAGLSVTLSVVAVSDEKRSQPESVDITANPDPVEDIFELSATNDSVTAGWIKPSMGAVDGYDVSCATEQETLGEDARQWTCSGIDPGAVVEVDVYSVSNEKQSTKKSVNITAYPVTVVLTEADATTDNITVQWALVEKNIDSFTVECEEGEPFPNPTIGIAETEAGCNNVTAGRAIDVTVTSVRGNKTSPATRTVRALPNAVSDWTIGAPTTSSVAVSWNHPTGDLDSYAISCSNDSDPSPASVNMSDTLEASCEGVTAGDTVEMTIVTVSGSKRSSPTVVRATAKPNPVADLDEAAESTTSVTATWERPLGIVSYYTVGCSSGTPVDANVTDEGQQSYSASCVNLTTPGGEYTLTVTSYSQDVPGEPKDVIITAEPLPPILREADSPSNDSITVEWSQVGGEVDNYHVECVNGTESPSSVIEAIEANMADYTASCIGLPVPGSAYTIAVFSESNMKNSTIELKTITSSPHGVYLTAIAPTVSVVGVSWTDRGGSEVTSYEVSCEPGDKSRPENRSILAGAPPYTGRCLVDIPGELYNITVSSVSGRATSPPSTKDLRALPEAVAGLEVDFYGTDFVALRWNFSEECKPPSNQCVWTSLELTYSTNDSALSIDITRDETFHRVSSLTPGANYTFDVVVVSDGVRSLSETVAQQTKPEAMESLELTFTTDTANLAWNMSESCAAGDCIWSGFYVSYTSDNLGGNRTEGWDTRETTFHGLQPGGGYNFSIFVLSGGEESEIMSLFQHLVPEAVQNFYVTSYSVNNVSLAWDVATRCMDGGCEWTSYDINYGSDVYEAGKLDTAGTITDLIAGEQYDFSIVVISSGEQSAEKNVTQRTKPEAVDSFTVLDYQTTEVRLGWELTSTCNSSNCVWSGFQVSSTPDTEEYLSDSKTENAAARQTRFSGLIPGERYTFEIIVQSSGQNSSRRVQVQRTVPRAVESLNVTSYNTLNVSLSWEIASECFPENSESADLCVWSSYEIDYSATSGGTTPMNTTAGKDDTSKLIENLTPGEEYDFIITVISDKKESSKMNVTQRTKPEAVDSLSVQNYTTTEVELEWNLTAPCNSGNCVWSGFLLSYTPEMVGFSEGSKMVDMVDAREMQFDGLIPGEEYTFGIIVQSHGEESIEETQLQRTKPEAVETFHVVDVSEYTVSLEWNLTQTCQDFKCVWSGFDVTYTSQNELDPSGDSGGLGKAENNTTFRTLIPGEEYTFQIKVESDEEESAPVSAVQRTMPESVAAFDVSDYTSSTAYLNWADKEACAAGNCTWTGYEIRYEAENGSSDMLYPGRGDTSAQFDGLFPGEFYTFNITVVSYNASSIPETATQRLRPADVQELTQTDKQQTNQITVTWAKPPGVVDGYETSISGGPPDDDGSKIVNTLTVTYSELVPGVEYNIMVCSLSRQQRCMVESKLVARTAPTPSSRPTNLKVQEDEVVFTRAIVTFGPPEQPNGIIERYIISYSGTKEGEQNPDDNARNDVQVVAEEGRESYTEEISNLRPGYTYTFQVVAENDGGTSAPAENKITMSQKEPVKPDPVSPISQDRPPTTEVKSFSFELDPDLFSHCNGEILFYTVLVTVYQDNQEFRDRNVASSGTTPPATQNYDDWVKSGKKGEYQAFSEQPYPYEPNYDSCNVGRKKREVTKYEKISIGDGSLDDSSYKNGELSHNTEYAVRIRVFNDQGYSESMYSEPIATELNSISWLIPLLFVLAVLIILGMFFIWKERRNPGKLTAMLKRTGKQNGGMVNAGFESDKPMRRTGDQRPVKLGGFAEHLEEMSRDSDYLFSEEYNDLRPVGKNQLAEAAEIDPNKVKNRFSNILPYDHTRVHLASIDDEPGSDYINANYMIGYKSTREYIACQGPLQNTEEDMWRMVWEQGASIIVMVTQLMEKGKIKCHQYWPEEGEGPIRYGDIVVRPMGRELNELWVTRKFIMSVGPSTREITHFNFTAWPDHGVPEKPEDLIQFVQAVRNTKKHDGKPVVVHCSAGVGRTGTFIALDTLMNTMEHEDQVDIFGLVRKMRLNRCCMVQTESQYIFIHECINALVEGANEVIYENQNGPNANGPEENIYYNEALI